MLSRRWHAKTRAELRNIALFIVDELHLVGGRNGPAIEVSRALTVSSVLQAAASMLRPNETMPP